MSPKKIHKIMKVWPQNFIQEALKVEGALKSKWCNPKLIISFMYLEICLWIIYIFHLDLAVSLMKVKFGEKRGPYGAHKKHHQ